MIYITYLSMAVLLYKRIKEMYKLHINYKNWKYLYNNYLHNFQHQVLLFMTIMIMILMYLNCTNGYWIPILIYNLFAIFFLIPHLREERKELN